MSVTVIGKKPRKPPRPKLKQVIPESFAPFEIVEKQPGRYWWEIVIQDDTDENDRPHFECRIGPGRSNKPAPIELVEVWPTLEVVKAGARECAEARGYVAVTKFVNGVPIESGLYRTNCGWGHWFIWKRNEKGWEICDLSRSLTD